MTFLPLRFFLDLARNRIAEEETSHAKQGLRLPRFIFLPFYIHVLYSLALFYILALEET